ncbi:MAG TPA: hypothetical protein VFW33_13885, partial [Gemmataceae bacterium]|nr:hypothetical protein [Gemmataceae bacterium]
PLNTKHEAAPSPGPSPSEVVAGAELLEAVRRELTGEECELADRRARGQGWDAIASEMGGTAQARRKQLERGIARVVERFALDEGS